MLHASGVACAAGGNLACARLTFTVSLGSSSDNLLLRTVYHVGGPFVRTHIAIR